MAFKLRFTKEAARVLAELESEAVYEPKLKKVRRALARLESDPRHPGLRSHKYHSARGADGSPLWDSYVENNTPSAWRIFWHYGPSDGIITIDTIGPHPD